MEGKKENPQISTLIFHNEKGKIILETGEYYLMSKKFLWKRPLFILWNRSTRKQKTAIPRHVMLQELKVTVQCNKFNYLVLVIIVRDLF
jgi:hypothetical protein